MEYLNASRTIATFVAESGEHAFLRCTLVAVTAEVPGFAAGVTERNIVEAVFVSDADAAPARFALAGYIDLPVGVSIATLLDDRGICHRPPGSSRRPAAPVYELPRLGAAAGRVA